MATGRARGPRTLVSVVAAVGLLVVLGSCSGTGGSGATADGTSTMPTLSDPTPSGPAGSTETTEATEPAETDETTEPAETDEPTAPATPPPSPALRATLVPASQLPALNLENPWRRAETARAEPEPPAWVCQPVPLTSSGAVRSWVRSYQSAGTSVAGQVVGEFADARSARRAFGALSGNARDCADELQARGRHAVGSVPTLADLDVPAGEAGWGVVFSGPVRSDPDAAHIDAVVVVRVGDRVSVVSMHSIGQDYNYEPGQSPPERAGPIVAARLVAGSAAG